MSKITYKSSTIFYNSASNALSGGKDDGCGPTKMGASQSDLFSASEYVAREGTGGMQKGAGRGRIRFNVMQFGL